MNKKEILGILKPTSISVAFSITIIAIIVNFAPPQVASLILNPDKIMKIAQYKQKKKEVNATKEANKLIKKDIQSPDGNLLNNSFDPSIGAGKDAGLTIIEYIDYKCGYCKKAHSVINRLLNNEKYKGKIRVIIKNYPVIGGETSLYAAEVATAFFQKSPDKFAKLHEDLMMSNLESPKTVDKKLSSFGVAYSDIKSEEARQAIIENFQFARSINISGTPAFIVGDELIGGFITYEDLAKKIDKKLKQD